MVSSAAHLDTQAFIDHTALPKAVHSHSLNAHRLTFCFLSSAILSNVRFALIHHKANLASGSINQLLLAVEFTTLLAR
jgi:hypothetical protein